MGKLKVQAQHLKAGDIVGTGEVIQDVVVNSIHWPVSKVMVIVKKGEGNKAVKRSVLWGKYTMIGVERNENK